MDLCIYNDAYSKICKNMSFYEVKWKLCLTVCLSFWQASRRIPANGSLRTSCRPGDCLDVGGVFPGIGLQSPFKIESLSIFDKRPNINDNTLVNRLWWSWRWAFLGNPYWNTAHLSESDRPWARSSQGILWNANGEIGVCVFFPSCRSLHRSEEYQCFMASLQVVCAYY